MSMEKNRVRPRLHNVATEMTDKQAFRRGQIVVRTLGRLGMCEGQIENMWQVDRDPLATFRS